MVTKVSRRNNQNKGAKSVRKVTHKYFIDCSTPIADGIFDLDHFEKYLLDNYRVSAGAHKGDLAKKVKFHKKDERLQVNTTVSVSRQYLKYLTKKYLHKQEIGNWIRVVSAPGKGKGYQLKYFNIQQEEQQPEQTEESA